jgi:hypothetical protein
MYPEAVLNVGSTTLLPVAGDQTAQAVGASTSASGKKFAIGRTKIRAELFYLVGQIG